MNLEREKLVLDYMPLAETLAWRKHKVTPRCVGVDELKSAAYMGLVDAASRYDKCRGIAFGVYARVRICGEMQDYLRELGWAKKKKIPMISLDFTTEAGTLADLLETQVEGEWKNSFEETIKCLTAIGQRVLTWYYIEGWTMKEIGRKEGISESRISQILKECREKIKNRLELRDKAA